MTEPKRIKIDQMQIAYDLNGTKSQFKVQIHVHSDNNADFDFAIVSQSDIDNEQVKFQRSRGGAVVSELESKSGQYQNYFLILKTDPSKGDKPIDAKYWVETIQRDLPTPPGVQGATVGDVDAKKDNGLFSKINTSHLVWLALIILVVLIAMKKR